MTSVMMIASGVLCAEWRDLVMISYEVDPLLLVPLVPAGTSLDFFGGRAIVTVVGLRFMNTRIAGVPVPHHHDLEQVNFRFYVWRQLRAEIRPGVVFIKEIVPSAAITLGARVLFTQRYETAPMRHEVVPGEQGWASYEWQVGNRWNRVSARRKGPPHATPAAGIEAFVTDRPWSYARQRDGSTLEYRIEHPAWEISAAAEPTLDCDVARVCGAQFVATLSRPPISAFIAAGSDTVLHPGDPID